MSRSNPVDEVKNPAKRFYEWNGSNGCFTYYDKMQEKNVEVKLPFTFLVLDQLSTVKGWNDSSESGIYSNEVRNLKKEIMTVKAFKGGQIAQGFYSEIKDRVKAEGGKFTSSVYIAVKNPETNELEIANLQLSGAAVNAWMDFKKEVSSLYEGAVTVTDFVEGKKGSITFKVPKFKMGKVSPQTDNAAKDLDKTLQSYFKVYFADKVVREDAPLHPQPENAKEADYMEAQAEFAKRQANVTQDPFTDETIDLGPADVGYSEDVPF